ncbi:MAG: hypothetical protein KDB12_13940 [Ilumatobacter sp.]|nr:hypothetical protein [Ilumatobacter sp.]
MLRRRRRPNGEIVPATPRVVARRSLPVHSSVALQPGVEPVESLRTVRRAVVGRWWVQVMPRDGCFRAEAHTMSGPPGVWAGEHRSTLGEAIDDGVAIIGELSRE